MKKIIFSIAVLLMLAACNTPTPEVKEEVSLFPPYPDMDPPLYEPLEDAPYDARVFMIELTEEGFNPETLTVNSGEDLKLLVTALDEDHDFRMDEFAIMEPLQKFQEAIITFKPQMKGSYEFRCVKNCNPDTVGRLIVR
jgi:heme/copper-type cytochrome/quinol oxidase subunit 2